MSNKICNFCEMEIKTSDNIMTCSKCGKIYHKECWEVMGECRHSLEDANSEQILTISNNTQEQADNNFIYCTNCGNKVSKNTVTCPSCGVKVFDGTKMNTNQQINSSNFDKNMQSAISSNYVDMLKHVLLLLFTFGIYHCIWIYKTTEYTNQIKPSEERNTTVNLLLCLFVPFYIIFWYYKTAEIIYDCIDNSDSNFKTMVLIFSIFAPIVSAILVQDKINKTNPDNTDVNNIPAYKGRKVGPCNENLVIEEIKKYKELLDIDAITQEEFDIKKKEILGL